MRPRTDLGAAAAHVLWSTPTVDRADQAWLDAGEVRRLDRIARVESRQEFLTSRVLVKTLVAELSGVEPFDVRLGYTCALCGEGHGRPVVTAPRAATRVHVSLAHSGQRVVVAASTAAPIGVDVEALAATGFDGFDAVALTPEERRSLRRLDEQARTAARAAYWARKEALLKASGEGLTLDPATVELARTGAQLRDLDVGEGYAAALAVLTERPLGVFVLRVSAATEVRAEPLRAASDAGTR
jgi:4'-phosphopantetheinyl transferase